MVDRSSLQEVNDLYAEYNDLNNALANLHGPDGKIVSMIIAGPTAPPANVPTDDIPVPPQMVNSIRDILTSRQNAIRSELIDLGLAGMEQPGATPWQQHARRQAVDARGRPIDPATGRRLR